MKHQEINNSIVDWDLYHKIMVTPTIWELEIKYRKKEKRGIFKRLLRWLRSL